MDDRTVGALRAAIESDAAFQSEFANAKSASDALAVVNRRGWQATAAEVEGLFNALAFASTSQGSEAELDRVSGGSQGDNPLFRDQE